MDTVYAPGDYRVLILARSFKGGGWCVAGKILGDETVNGIWIRPVKENVESGLDDAHVFLSKKHRLARPGDVVTMPVAAPAPHLFQHENRQVAGTWRWERNFAEEDVLPLIETPESLWGAACQGLNDRVGIATATFALSSLLLIRCPRVVLYLYRNKCRAAFFYNQVAYDLAVTCPNVRSEVDSAGGRLDRHDALMTLSLSLPFGGYCYKLVAGLISLER